MGLPSPRASGGLWRDVARTHWALLVVLAVAIASRVALLIAYRPALFATGDSYSYLWSASCPICKTAIAPDPQRPIVYSLFLRPVLWARELMIVPVVQHIAGILIGIAVYALLRRFGVRPWLATVGAAPVLLDSMQITLEHYLMTETLFEAFVLGALLLLVWRDRPAFVLFPLAGLLLASAALTRTVGLVLIVPAIAYVLARRLGVLRVAAMSVAFAVPIVGYAFWYEWHYGVKRLGNYEGIFLYGRVAPFADCRGLAVPPEERPLCGGPEPATWPGWYVFDPASPLQKVPARDDRHVNEIAGSFARRIIRHQPGDYAAAVVTGLAHYARPERTSDRLEAPTMDMSALPRDGVAMTTPQRAAEAVAHYEQSPSTRPFVHRRLSAVLVRWQYVQYVPGPVIVALFLAGLAGAVARVRSRGALECLLFASSALALILVPVATVVFDWRYIVPTLPLVGAAGALGTSRVLEWLAGRGARPGQGASAAPLEREDAEEERREDDLEPEREQYAGRDRDAEHRR